MTGVSGCLDFGGDGKTGTETLQGFEFRDRVDESVTIQVTVNRPLDWTPPGTATRTSEGFSTDV